jgi:hypothetical protein
MFYEFKCEGCGKVHIDEAFIDAGKYLPKGKCTICDGEKLRRIFSTNVGVKVNPRPLNFGKHTGSAEQDRYEATEVKKAEQPMRV